MKKKFFANLWLTFHSWSPLQIQIEQNRCAMACQGCGAAFFFLNNKIGNGNSYQYLIL